MSGRRGAPKQPYTTGYINTDELHFVRSVARQRPTKEILPAAAAGVEWEMECGRIGPVTELKDRTAAEVLATEELCGACVTAAWIYQLRREAGSTVRNGRENGSS